MSIRRDSMSNKEVIERVIRGLIALVVAYGAVTLLFSWNMGAISINPLAAMTREDGSVYFNDVFFYLISGALGAIVLLCLIDKGFLKTVKGFLNELKETLNDFCKFLSNNKVAVIVSILLICIAYGFEVTNFILSIDEESQIAYGPQPEGWAYEGRFGIGIFKRLFMNFGMFPPYFANFIAVAFLALSGFFLVYLVYSQRRNHDKIKWYEFITIFSFCCLFTPVWVEVLTFSTYSIEITFAFGIAVIGTVMLARVLNNGNKNGVFWTLLCYVISFMFYQAFIPVVFSLIASLYIVREIEGVKDNTKLGISVKIFIAALVVYGGIYLIGRFVQVSAGSDGYLIAMTGAESNAGPIDEIIQSLRSLKHLIVDHIWTPGMECFAMQIAFSFFAMLLAVLFHNKARIKVGVYLFILAISPYLMWILLRSTQLPIRTFLAAPISLAISAYVVLKILSQRKQISIIKPAVVVLILFLAMNQAQDINRLFYGDSIRAEMDISMARDIAEDIQIAIDGPIDRPVVIIGTRDLASQNNLIVQYPQTQAHWGGDALGYSLWRRAAEPVRMHGLFLVAGYEVNFESATEEEIHFANTYMDIWPSKDSIVVYEDKILIRIS